MSKTLCRNLEIVNDCKDCLSNVFAFLTKHNALKVGEEETGNPKQTGAYRSFFTYD